MNNLAVFISNYLRAVEETILADLPDLPEWSWDLPTHEWLVEKTYLLPDIEGHHTDRREEITVSFYADTQYNEKFYGFIIVDNGSAVELKDESDPTFGDIGGFRIYLDRV